MAESRIETGAGTKRLHKLECRVSQTSPVESRDKNLGGRGKGEAKSAGVQKLVVQGDRTDVDLSLERKKKKEKIRSVRSIDFYAVV